MTALLTIALALGATAYAVWPLLRGRPIDRLPEPAEREGRAEAETAALLAWSAAACEWAETAKEAGKPALDPE